MNPLFERKPQPLRDFIPFLCLQASCCLHWLQLFTSSPSCSCVPGGPSAGPSTRSSSAACVSWWPSSVPDTSSFSTSTSSSSSRSPSQKTTPTSGLRAKPESLCWNCHCTLPSFSLGLYFSLLVEMLLLNIELKLNSPGSRDSDGF